MIPNQWYVVLESNEVKAGQVVGATRFGERLIFWREPGGELACFRDQCPHRGAALSSGKVLPDGDLQCPFHGFTFDTSGRCTLIPANGQEALVPQAFRARSYPIREAHGLVYLWYGDPQPSLPEPPFFTDLDETFSYASARDPWHAHYTRVIENQLDVAHVPFLHHNTIGRGGRTLVDGPLVEWQDERLFFVYVMNRLDDGRPPLKPSQVTRPDVPFKLEFLFPNLWQNHISPKVRVLAAFVPVDDEHTLLYLRFYQNFVRAPLLRSLINRLAMPFNLFVAHQDRVIVETQRPYPSGLRIGEKLIQADRPVIAYREKRQALIEASVKPAPVPSPGHNLPLN